MMEPEYRLVTKKQLEAIARSKKLAGETWDRLLLCPDTYVEEVLETERKSREELTVEEARKRAKKWIKDHPKEQFVFRSCWNCNGAHEHLKNTKFVLFCPWCGHYYWNGVDVTIFDEEGEK